MLSWTNINGVTFVSQYTSYVTFVNDMDDFAAHADPQSAAALPIFDALFAPFDGRLPKAAGHAAAGRTASRSKARR